MDVGGGSNMATIDTATMGKEGFIEIKCENESVTNSQAAACNPTANDIQHLVHIVGSGIKFAVTVQGMQVQGDICNVPHDVYIDVSKVWVLLDLLGYKLENVDIGASIYNAEDAKIGMEHTVPIEYDNIRNEAITVKPPNEGQTKCDNKTQSPSKPTTCVPVVDYKTEDANMDGDAGDDGDFNMDSSTDDEWSVLENDPVSESATVKNAKGKSLKLKRQTHPKTERRTVGRPSKTPGRKKDYPCLQCGEICNGTAALHEHHQTSHKDKTTYMCWVCGVVLVKSDHYYKHMKSHSGEKKHQCSLCGAKFMQVCNLKMHMRSHSDEKNHVCQICGAMYKSKHALTYHEMGHTGERPFVCTVCGLGCKMKNELKRHMRIHTGDKRYKCTECPYACIEGRTMKGHMRIHTGEKPYQCPHCPSSFRQLCQVKIHIMTHTGEKPYKCTSCPYATVSIGHLKRHIKCMHKYG